MKAVINVVKFGGSATPDSNGKLPIMLLAVSGTIPNRNVLSGTVAINLGFEVGKSYLVDCKLRGVDDEFGPTYNWTNLLEMKSAMDILDMDERLGEGNITQVTKPENNSYERKGVAIVGKQRARIASGHFTPVNASPVKREIDSAEKELAPVNAGTAIGGDE